MSARWRFSSIIITKTAATHNPIRSSASFRPSRPTGYRSHSRIQRTAPSVPFNCQSNAIPCHYSTPDQSCSTTHQASSYLTEQGLIGHMSILSTVASTTLDLTEELRFLCLDLLTIMYPTEITQSPSSSSYPTSHRSLHAAAAILLSFFISEVCT